MRTEFYTFIGKMIGEYTRNTCYHFYYHCGVTFCYDDRTNKVGIARRHPEDRHNEQIGRVIAYARCKGYEIPKQVNYKTLNEMESGEVFFSLRGFKNIFIGKCKNHQDDIVFVTQNVGTGNIFILTDGTRRYEMAD